MVATLKGSQAAACRIAMIEPVGGHGGMNYYDFGLCDGLGEAGIDVVLHTCDKTTLPVTAKFSTRHSFRGIFSDAPNWIRGLRYISGTIRSVGSAVRERRSICHFHSFHVGVLQLIGTVLARLLLRTVVVTAHDIQSFVASLERPLVSRLVYLLAARVIVHNEYSRQELGERLGVEVTKIAVIPHGNFVHVIDSIPDQFGSRASLGIPANAKVLLFFGHIKDVKGLDLLIQALPLVLQRHPDAFLVIAGKPWKSDFSRSELLIDKFKLRQNCLLHIRHIPDEDVPRYYSAGDVVVLPYRRIYQSGVVLMAMNYGKAVLVSDIQGMAEIVRDGETGFVFRSGDQDDLARRLCHVLENSTSRASVASRGLEYVRKHHDWRSIGIQTAALYSELE
jgi:D-inositol-3-phosphate glycosyltransferase